MTRHALVAGLLLLASTAPAQEFPKSTEEGRKALAELLRLCEKEGALALRTDPRTKADRIVVADQQKLQDVVKAQRRRLTPPLRDSLVHLRDHPGAMALLLAIGQETADRQATAFAAFFLARLVEQAQNLRLAQQGYEGAARLFAELAWPAWEAVALGNLGAVCKARGDPARARKSLQRALDLFQKAHGERHPLVATARVNLAAVCQDQGDLTAARKLNEQALALLEALHGTQHVSVATALNNLAEVHRAQGDLPQARRLHERTLAMRRKLQNVPPEDVAQSLNNLATVCHLLGESALARKLQEQALESFTRLHGERHPAVATALVNLGAVCVAQGDLFQARTRFERALALFVQLRGPDHPSVAAVLSNLAEVSRTLGERDQARKLHERALAVRRKSLGERHPDVAASLNNLAEVCRDQGDLAQARKLHAQALALNVELHGERHPAVATSLNNLAEIYHATGNRSRARRLHERALAIRKRLLGERHPAIAQSLGNLAVLAHEEGESAEAVRCCTEAVLACRLPQSRCSKLADLRNDDLTCTADTILCLHVLGNLLQAPAKERTPGRARQAAHVYALAADLLDFLRGDILLTDADKLFRGAEQAGLVPARVHLAATLFDQSGKAEDLHDAFAAVEQGRARVFVEALARSRAHQLGGVPDRLREQERTVLAQFQSVEERLRKENARSLDQRDAGLAARLYDEWKVRRDEEARFASDVRANYPRYAALRCPRPCTLEQARACLADNEVAVLFAVGRKETLAVVVQKRPVPGDRSGGVAVVKLPGRDVLGPKVRTLVDDEVLKSDSRCRQLGSDLYALLLKPLEKYIQGKDLVLAPDAVLWELPFEVLVQGRTGENAGQYLIETRQVRYTPSLTVLDLVKQWQEKRRTPVESLWALGDPVFSKDDKRAKGDVNAATQNLLARYALRGGPTWERLPATGAEVRAIADLFTAGKEVVTDTLASEKILKAASAGGRLARKRYVHLATHGILGSALGRPPSLVLSLVGNDDQEQLGGINDGFLTMQEVTHLKLNADLVVLSACETGKGELIASEGVVGLSRAFLYAGSRGVVCSLWQVDDERTAELMKALYTELKGGTVSSAEALAQARRKLIAQEQAPFYWAPFILIGR